MNPNQLLGEPVSNPYKDGETMYIRKDDQEEVWLDSRTRAIIQASFTPPETMGEALPQSQLRTLAQNFILLHVPSFLTLKTSLHPLEDNNGNGTYFLRWDDFRAPINGNDMPPFIQVGIRKDGALVSYLNTLNL